MLWLVLLLFRLLRPRRRPLHRLSVALAAAPAPAPAQTAAAPTAVVV
jgi:hypothetical protein